MLPASSPVWDKANRDERTSTENKISDGVLIARKAGSKLADQAEELEDEVDAYLRTHVVREVTSTEKAFKTVESFVGKAQDELGMGYAYLDDVTHADWQRKSFENGIDLLQQKLTLPIASQATTFCKPWRGSGITSSSACVTALWRTLSLTGRSPLSPSSPT